jgi:acetyl-CoA C-acetyltransferase
MSANGVRPLVNTEAKIRNLSRCGVRQRRGCAEGTLGEFNVNRLCGSGLQAIISASQSTLAGRCRHCGLWWRT